MTRLLIIIIILCSCSTNSNKLNQEKLKVDSSIAIRELKIISDSTNQLETKVQKLELEYIIWGCACANWITHSDRLKYDTGGLAKHCIFIEPADKNFFFPASFEPEKNKIIVKGSFYVREDYPKGTIETEEQLEKAKVFRYTEFKIVKL
jgi:hypothetical protein